MENARRNQAKAYDTIVTWIDREIKKLTFIPFFGGDASYQNPGKVANFLGLKAEVLGKKARALETDTWPDMASRAVYQYDQQVKTQGELIRLLESLSRESELETARNRLVEMQSALDDRRKRHGKMG